MQCLGGNERIDDNDGVPVWVGRRSDGVLDLPADPGVSHLQTVLGHRVGQRFAGDGVDRVPRVEVATAARRDGRRRPAGVRCRRFHAAAAAMPRQSFVGDGRQLSRRRGRLLAAARRLGRVDRFADTACWRRRTVSRVVGAQHLRQTVLHNHTTHPLPG